MTIGEKIQNLRSQKGWSQERLAQELNLSRQSVSKWELGTATPTTENLKELAKIFGVSIDSLLENETIIPDIPEKNNKNTKTIPVLLTAAVFVILAGLTISQINIYKKLEKLENDLESKPDIVYMDSNNSNSADESLFAVWDINAGNCYQNKTMDILISVMPKKDTEDTKIEFTAEINGQQQTVTAEKQGNTYNAAVNVPWGANLDVRASVIRADGTIENEILPTFDVAVQDLYTAEIMQSVETGKVSASLWFAEGYTEMPIDYLTGLPVLVEWEVKEAGKTIGNGSVNYEETERYSEFTLNIIDNVKIKNPSDVIITMNITDEYGVITTITENLIN